MRYAAPLLFLLVQGLHAQTWTQLPDFPVAGRDDAASFAIGDNIYVGTGMDEGFQLTNDWYAFNTVTNQWNTIATPPFSARQYCTGFTFQDTGYVFGGLDGTGALNELWAYHPTQDVWEQRASLPAEGRFACVAMEAWQSAIVATGMLASFAPTNEAWKYHPDTDSWTPIAPVPGPSRHRAACFLDGGGMRVIGGADSVFAALSDAWTYPIWFETGLWYPSTALPAARYGGDAGGTGAMLFAAGASDASTFHGDVWMTNGVGWTSIAAFPPGPRRGGVGVGVQTDQFWQNDFYYGLGLDGNSQRHKDWWKLEVPVGIEERPWGSLLVAPNPGTNGATVRMPRPTSWTLSVTDAQGREILRTSGSSDPHFDSGRWPSGVYGLLLTEASGRTYRARWIKL